MKACKALGRGPRSRGVSEGVRCVARLLADADAAGAARQEPWAGAVLIGRAARQPAVHERQPPEPAHVRDQARVDQLRVEPARFKAGADFGGQSWEGGRRGDSPRVDGPVSPRWPALPRRGPTTPARVSTPRATSCPSRVSVCAAASGPCSEPRCRDRAEGTVPVEAARCREPDTYGAESPAAPQPAPCRYRQECCVSRAQVRFAHRMVIRLCSRGAVRARRRHESQLPTPATIHRHVARRGKHDRSAPRG